MKSGYMIHFVSLVVHIYPYQYLSGDFSSFAGDGSSEDENNDDGAGKKGKVKLKHTHHSNGQ